MGLETGNDLEDEQLRRASALSLFSFSLFSSIQVWMSEKQVSREDTECSVECSVKFTCHMQKTGTESSQKEVCIQDEED